MEESILIIDDEKKINNLLARIISLEGFKVFQAFTGKEGLKVLASNEIPVVISDVKLPDWNGVQLVKEIKKLRPGTEIINLTAFGTIADGVEAMRNGAFDYITKGDDNDKIIPLLHKALERSKLNARLSNLENRIAKKYSFDSMIGSSPRITEAVALARKVAGTDTTVLLLGETGTGKEVFAQAVHAASPRKDKSFVAVNCSGFSAELLESELFGYKSGAFTGANRDKKGLIEEANGGTLFLDEIGEMSLELQSKLLRILESQTFIKLGDTQTSRVNVRIVAATNRDLKTEAEHGRFRLDLYYRLSVFAIELPPLSHRREDIIPIATHFLAEFSIKVNRPKLFLSKEVANKLTNHSWKGNIRELKNLIERMAILADRDEITVSQLPFEFHTDTPDTSPMNMQMVEKQHILKVLHYTKGNKTETARLLGIGLTTLYRKIEEYQLEA